MNAALPTTPHARDAAEAAPAAAPTRHLSSEGGTLAYDDSGPPQGPLVVAVPGMGDLRSSYRRLRAPLVEAGCRVVTMDVRGHGDSSTGWPDLSARAVGRDIAALVRALGAGPAVVLGSSFAAGSALWAAADAPDTVRAAVLLGPIVRDAPPSAGRTLARAALALGFAGPWRVAFWTAYWNSLFPLARPADHAQQRQRLAASLREPGRMAALRTMVGLSKADTEAMVGRVRPPSLVVMGTRDPDFADPLAEADWLAGRLGAARLQVDGAGHYPHVEAPAAVASAVLALLAGLPAA